MTKLLVVDDELRTAELTAELLRRAGYTVDVAGSGAEALERVRTDTPDLMLLDYDMSDMEAPEVLDSLRSGAGRIPFPVIILTGARHSPADQVVGIEHGATDFIMKGTDRQVVIARVRGALRERSSAPGVLIRGRLRVDASQGEARLGDRMLKLERRPLLMLQLLASRAGEVVPRWDGEGSWDRLSVRQPALSWRRRCTACARLWLACARRSSLPTRMARHRRSTACCRTYARRLKCSARSSRPHLRSCGCWSWTTTNASGS